jgi:hypothetical protein
LESNNTRIWVLPNPGGWGIFVYTKQAKLHMAILTTPAVSVNLFSWQVDPVDGDAFVCEISDFEGNGGKLARVWDDACDVGFTLCNPKTGKSVKMVESEEQYCTNHWGERELVAIVYAPVPRQGYTGKPFTVLMFND